jgi:3-hydroxyacyl-CoA dehydrogenase
MGVIDEIIEGDLLEGALAYTERLLDEGAPQRKTRELAVDTASISDSFFDEYRGKIARKTRGYYAPERNIQAVEASIELPFDEGKKREGELFIDCMMNPQAAALQYVFFAEREAAKIPDVPKDTPLRRIEKVGILGAGTMGGGIAMAYANAGIPVTIVEVDQEPLDKGLAVVKKNYMRSVKSGRFTEEKVEQLLGMITGSLDMNDFADCDLVIEAVFENMDHRRRHLPSRGRHRAALLQPGQRDAATRDRPRRQDRQGRARHLHEDGQGDPQGRRRRRRLLRLHRQPDAGRLRP